MAVIIRNKQAGKASMNGKIHIKWQAIQEKIVVQVEVQERRRRKSSKVHWSKSILLPAGLHRQHAHVPYYHLT